MRLCVLASGSSGNCTYLASDSTAILIDAGLSARRIAERVTAAGGSADQLHGVCVSHEHSDHTTGLRVLVKRHGIPLYANSGTVDALRRDTELHQLPWNRFTNGHAFTVGDLRIEPFSVPHDAYDPVGFVVSHHDTCVGVVTDMGMATNLIRERLRPCHAIVLEANHDERLLQEANRPWSLIQRIRGRQGHLSNQAAASLLHDIAAPHLQHVFLAHLSEDCNRPELAVQAGRQALDRAGCEHVAVSLTYPDRISTIWDSAATAATQPPVQPPAQPSVTTAD
jgi:phosphoribosyl 1,2-cyclic phosphodiesterase